MPRKHTPGCTCCTPPLCVTPPTSCSPDPGYLNHWLSAFTFPAVTSSALVPGTSWRSQYNASFAGGYNANAGGAPSQAAAIVCTLTYNPLTHRWYGYTDSPPAEPGYAYRWNWEIASNSTLTVDPGANGGCAKRFWISDRAGNPLTPDFGLVGRNLIGVPYSVTSAIAFDVTNGSHACGHCGELVTWQTYLPKCLLGWPASFKLTIAGLSSPNHGSLDGDYILQSGVQIIADNGACSGYGQSKPLLCPTRGFTLAPNDCPFPGYTTYWYMLLDPYCQGPSTYRSVAMLAWGRGGPLNLYFTYNSVPTDPSLGNPCYQTTATPYWPTAGVPLDIFGGSNAFALQPGTVFGLAGTGITLPATMHLAFNSW
jgi:hypothetical protein